MEKCNEKIVVNIFSIKQDGLDFVFAQHYFLNWDSSESMFCNVCKFNVKGTSPKIFLFSKVWLGSPGSAFSVPVVM